LEHPTHRDVFADMTTPNSSFTIASAGQTFAQAGSSQCMQICITVCGLVARFT
jgi:hypothetical protein